MRYEGDRWWPATLLLFGPRWVWATPLVLLLPLAVIFRRRSLLVLCTSAVVVIGPIMGLCLPWGRVLGGASGGSTLRVLTCNTHWHALRTGAMRQLLIDTHPDIIALQECSRETPAAILTKGKWYIDFDGELCVASRYPIRRVANIAARDWRDLYGSAMQYQVMAAGGAVTFINLHLESPHMPIRGALLGQADGDEQVEDNSRHRWRQALHVARHATDAGPDVIMAGDFNTPSDSRTFRQAFGDFEDAYSEAGFGFGWTYHHSGTRTRIDHIVSGAGWHCEKCWVGPNVGSPHRPVIADLRETPVQKHAQIRLEPQFVTGR